MKPKLTPEMLAKALHLQGEHRSQAEIAFTLQVSRATVSRTLKKVNAAAYEKLKRDIAAEKGRQIGQFHRIMRESFAAWRKSVETAETIETTEEFGGETPDGPMAVVTKVKRTVKGQNGNPAHLATLMTAMEGVRTLLGIGAAEDTDVPTVQDALAEAVARDAEYRPALPPPKPDKT